jgi:predicted  nucleic acid-binding Zn-ribbon protein
MSESDARADSWEHGFEMGKKEAVKEIRHLQGELSRIVELNAWNFNEASTLSAEVERLREFIAEITRDMSEQIAELRAEVERLKEAKDE